MNYQYAVAVKELNGITDNMAWSISRTGKKKKNATMLRPRKGSSGIY